MEAQRERPGGIVSRLQDIRTRWWIRASIALTLGKCLLSCSRRHEHKNLRIYRELKTDHAIQNFSLL